MANGLLEGNLLGGGGLLDGDDPDPPEGLVSKKMLSSIDFGGVSRILGLPAPASANEPARLVDLQNSVQGIQWKQAVRAATTANGTLATAYENGDAIDGVTLATGDRILLKNQTAGAENGIYTVNASGAPTRATDFDASSEVLQATVFVQEGTTLADTIWNQTTNAPITLGTTALVWAQIGAGAGSSAGLGLVQNGGAHDVNVDGTTLQIVSDVVSIHPSYRVLRFAANVGDGTNVSYAITHSLNTRDVEVEVYRGTTPWDTVDCEVERTDANTVTLRFDTAPSSNQHRVVVTG
jgi:hypothetical protein